jgi:hypothetical protein
VETNVLAPVPHRQYVFTIPRLLRPIFARRRALLSPESAYDLSAVVRRRAAA